MNAHLLTYYAVHKVKEKKGSDNTFGGKAPRRHRITSAYTASVQLTPVVKREDRKSTHLTGGISFGDASSVPLLAALLFVRIMEASLA